PPPPHELSDHHRAVPVRNSPLFPSHPRPPPKYTLFPYTTLFRSHVIAHGHDSERVPLPELRCLDLCRGELSTSPVVIVEPEIIRSEEHTSELQSRSDLVCRLLLEKKKQQSILLHIFSLRELLKHR